jgi:hypothetical protein
MVMIFLGPFYGKWNQPANRVESGNEECISSEGVAIIWHLNEHEIEKNSIFNEGREQQWHLQNYITSLPKLGCHNKEIALFCTFFLHIV